MALRILQFSTLFTIGYSLGTQPDPSFAGLRDFPIIEPSLNLTDPKDVVVLPGQKATLKCEAVSSDGDVQFTWLRNEQKLPKNDTRWVMKPDGGLYTGVGGKYQCLVTNNAGALLSNVARLRVATIESEFSTHPENQEVPQGQIIVLKCSIHSVPPANIQWEFNNLTLPHSNRYVPLPYGTLVIQDSRISDSGSYRCKAANDLVKKTTYSNPCLVSITVPMTSAKTPSILPFNFPINKTIVVGENVTFYCAATGFPLPTVQWFNNRNHVISHGPHLNINNASRQDTGNYTCVAKNDVGQAEHHFRLAVLQKPRFVVKPTSISPPPFSTVRFECKADGVPEPRIMWLKDGKLLNYTARIKMQQKLLVFSHTFTSDSGFYQCVAVNAAGRVWTAALISINHQQQPKPPQNLQCRSYGSSSVCLTWTATSNVTAYGIYSAYKKNGEGQEFSSSVSNMTFQLIEDLNNNINYTFYVVSFSTVASNASESVTCAPGKNNKRHLDIKLMKPDSVLVKWNEINTDRECNGKQFPYEVQWREIGRESALIEYTNQQSLVIEELKPTTYEFRVTTISNQKAEWIKFVLPIDGNYTSTSIVTERLNRSDSVALYIDRFEGVINSSTSVTLKWLCADKSASYFTVCYYSLNQKNVRENCDEEELLKRYVTESKVDGLEPNTTYEFKIRAYNANGLHGPYSQSILIHTPEEVPSPVQDLDYKIINDTTVCLHWHEPQRKTENLQSYVISYTPDKNWPLENWFNISIWPYQQRWKNCWVDDKTLLDNGPHTVSMILGNLTSEKQYMLLVRAVSKTGISDPTYPLIINTKIIMPSGEADSLYKQKLGILFGTVIALICILFGIMGVLLRRRCLKRRATARARLAASNNLYPVVARYATDADTVQVRLEDTCALESQHLVPEPLTTNIPPITTNHLDTKGVEEFPNGYLNGSARPYMNGLSQQAMHIRENPQFYAHQCNGHTGNRKPFRFEEDSNSNVKPSKFYNLHRLFENSKKAGTSKYNKYGTSENSTKCTQSSDDETPNEYDSLNTTRLTCLDDSFDLNVNNNKSRISPVIGPNG